MTDFIDLSPPRAGRQFRASPNRFFHVMNEGWYVNTREGVKGPFVQREQAEQFLTDLMGRVRG